MSTTSEQQPSSPSSGKPRTPNTPKQRESADEKIMKALLHRAMKDVLSKKDDTLLTVAQSMVDSGQVREKVPQRNLSDDEILSMLDKPTSDRE
jgi:uncharacterized protein YqeY